MKRPSTMLLPVTAGLLGVLLTSGCASSTQTITPQDKARFGYVGMPKPPEAQKYIEQHVTGAPPPTTPARN